MAKQAKEMRSRAGIAPKEHSHKLEGAGPLAGWDLYFIARRHGRGGAEYLSMKIVWSKGKIKGAANYWLAFDFKKGCLIEGRDTARLIFRWGADGDIVGALNRITVAYLKKVEAGELPPLAVAGGRPPAERLAEARRALQRAQELVARLESEKPEVDIFT